MRKHEWAHTYQPKLQTRYGSGSFRKTSRKALCCAVRVLRDSQRFSLSLTDVTYFVLQSLEIIIVNRSQTLNRFVALFLVSVCAASLFIGNVRVQADGGYSGHGNGSSAIDKCSPDLLKITDTAGATRVKVIVKSSTNSGIMLAH